MSIREPYWTDGQVTLLLGDALEVLRELPDEFADCCVTSPPYYGLRDYGMPGQYGLEASPAEYVATMRAVFAEVRRVLARDGTLWLNIGDSYASRADSSAARTYRRDRAGVLPPRRNTTSGKVREKNLLMIPERVILALQEDGWTVRTKGVWHMPNCTPESVKDRLANRWEPFYMLTRSRRYWFNLDAIRVPHSPASLARARRSRITGDRSQDGVGTPNTFSPAQMCREEGANPGDVWAIGVRGFPGAHFAVYAPEFPLRCLKAGCKPGGMVLDPFSGTGTTGQAARMLGHRYTGIELNPAFHVLAATRRVPQGGLDMPGGGGAA